MTLEHFGLALRIREPRFNSLPLSDLELAQYVLNLHPDGYQMISPTAFRIKEITDRPRKSSKLWEGNRLKNEALMIANDRAEVQALLEMDAAIHASAEGVTLPVYEEMRKMGYQAKLQGEVSWEERRQSIEASRLLSLEVHRILQSLKQDLYNLYAEEHAIEVGPEPAAVKAKKLSLIANHIAQLEEDFRERGIRYLVQASPGFILRGADEDADSGSDNPETLQAGEVQAAPQKARVGF
jgi:hypothetical protein